MICDQVFRSIDPLLLLMFNKEKVKDFYSLFS